MISQSKRYQKRKCDHQSPQPAMMLKYWNIHSLLYIHNNLKLKRGYSFQHVFLIYLLNLLLVDQFLYKTNNWRNAVSQFFFGNSLILVTHGSTEWYMKVKVLHILTDFCKKCTLFSLSAGCAGSWCRWIHFLFYFRPHHW